MSESKEQEPKKVLSLSGRGKLELKRPPESTSQVRQSFSHGRSKPVTVEVKRKRVARRRRRPSCRPSKKPTSPNYSRFAAPKGLCPVPAPPSAN